LFFLKFVEDSKNVNVDLEQKQTFLVTQ